MDIKMKLKIGDKEIELTETEMRELYNYLALMFEKQTVYPVPVYPDVIPWDRPWVHPWITYTAGGR